MSLMAIGLTTGCGGGSATAEKSNNQTVPNQMTMTSTAQGEVNLLVGGYSDVVIDWGDGSDNEIIALSDGRYEKCPHTFADATARVVKITGEKINFLRCMDMELSTLDVSQITSLEELSCGSNNLTALNLSANTALTTVYCDWNKLSAEALNDLFKTLHQNTIAEKKISIERNPGTDACNTSIATDKGWEVER